MQNLDCSYCRRTFYKPEHLKRHERSHTGARPFICTVCDRAFSRQDSLHRHQRLHSRARTYPYASPSPSNGTALSTSEDGVEPEVETPPQSRPSVTAIPRSQCATARSPSVPISIDQIASQPLDHTQRLNSDQLDYGLVWPDSEALFQTMVSTAPSEPQQPLPSSPLLLPGQTPFGDQPPSISAIPPNGNNQVVSGITKMITLQSSSITEAVNANSINSLFLDECLHMFFVRFIPTFPILHRPTFVFRDCIQPLLLNCMAIGSLYLGHSNAVAQGEILWRLAHTALVTMWQHMISHRGPYDERSGVQLVITAVLGQIYGILSKNQTIRMTSHAFQALAFVWAKQCGIYTPSAATGEQILPLEGSAFEKDQFWRRWVARSIQHRAVLAQYALDGLISRTSGTSTSERHLSNRLPLSFDDGAFAAQNVDDFLVAVQMIPTQTTNLTFRSTLSHLLSPTAYEDMSYYNLSSFSLMVLQEGLQSVLTEKEDNYDNLNYLHPGARVDGALARIHEISMNSIGLSSAERLEANLRWHAVSLEAITNTTKLCRVICRVHNIEQSLWMPDDGLELGIDLAQWPGTEDGRRALLHAVAIQAIIEDLPRGRAHAIHMPSALLAAATVCATFCLAGVTTVNLPSTVCWKDVISSGAAAAAAEDEHHASATRNFILGKYDSSTVAFGAYRNLPYEFNSMQKLFGCLATQWGVAQHMSAIVRQWAAMFH